MNAGVAAGGHVKLRVLVVEDDRLQRETLASLLIAQDYSVETADDGLAGLRLARLGWFHLVLMDCGLPEIEGEQAAQLIAELAADGRRPVLIGMSARPAVEAAASARPVFDAFVSKPWEPQSLLRTIARSLGAPDRPPSTDAPFPPLVPDPAPADGRAEPARAVRVLIADDDDLFRTMLASALGGLGYEILLAAGGFAALRILRERAPDIAILDYRLPELDGLAIARLTFDLVAAPRRGRLIALTATPEVLAERAGEPANPFDAIIAKSSGLSVLIDAVEHCAAYRKLRALPVGVPVLPLTQALGRVCS